MANHTPLGLRQRLLAAIVAPLTLVFAIGAFLDYRLARETADAAFDQSLADAVLDIAAHLRSGQGEVAVELSDEAEAMLRSDATDRIYFAVRDGDGRLLAGDDDLPFLRVAATDQPQFVDTHFRDRGTRAAIQHVASHRGEITITVAETLAKRNRASRRIMTAMILPNLGVIFATLLAVYLGIRRGLAPLEQVETEIGARSPRDLREIDVAAAPREIRPMLLRLNELFGLLREAAAAQQRFVADAAHQLRTPLAGLQTQIDLAADPGTIDGERRARIDEATARIGHLVNQLLTYAQAEPAAAANRVFVPVALHDLAEQAASLFLDQALAKGIDLGFDIRPATAQGVPWMLREALAVLVDNALRYTPAGGTVTVRSGEREGVPCLEVEDNGPGIPASERQRIFERFYRLPGSPGDGCGMGLAILQEIAATHGARIELEDPPGGGLRMVLLLPAREP